MKYRIKMGVPNSIRRGFMETVTPSKALKGKKKIARWTV